MADIYSDITNGDDGTGDGSSGNPYASIQTAVNNATYGDTIHVANTGINTLASAITFNTGFTNSGASSISWLIFKAWDNGGARTITCPDGSEVTAFEVDGNNTVTEIFEYSTMPNPARIFIDGGKLYDATAYVLRTKQRFIIKDCDLSQNEASAPVLRDQGNQLNVINSNIRHEFGGKCVELGNSVLDSCFIFADTGSNNYCIESLADAPTIFNCILKCNGQYTVSNGNNHENMRFINNTFINNGTNSADGFISLEGEHVLYNNLFYGYSGTGAHAVNVGATSSDGCAYVGYNAFYNCDDDYENLTRALIDDTAFDVTESEDPLTDAAGGDYSIKSTALCIGAGKGGRSIGASQLSSAGSSGGGGQIFT